MDAKAFIPPACVVLGWFLGQGSNLAKDILGVRRLKKSLLCELKDIKENLLRAQLIYERKIQISEIKGFEASAPVMTTGYFFKNHYKDVITKLNHSQRRSFQLIHESLNDLNTQNAEFTSRIRGVSERLAAAKTKEECHSELSAWQQDITCLLLNTLDIIWYIDRHLAAPNNPFLDLMGPMHEDYLKYQEACRDHVRKVKEYSKTLSPKDFEKIYDENMFHPAP